MQLQNGYFHDRDGKRFVPFGIFGNYFRVSYTGDTLVRSSRHGCGSIEFQKCTMDIWERFFRFLREDGINTIRLFPRGDSGGAAWEGLDIGGRVNRDLLDYILRYAQTAHRFGIRTMLGLFTQPECSVYCRKDTRVYWGQRLFDETMRREATPAQKRFLDNSDDLVDYNDFFTDPDVRSCCHSFLDELLPLLKGNEDIFCLEIYNEMGWASPNADPMDTFRWELTDAYLDWSRDMVGHVRREVPEFAVCISNPGVGLLGHDPIRWMKGIGPDFFSYHNYPDICGAPKGMGIDYASVADMCISYTAAAGTAMYGEWDMFRDPERNDDRIMALLARDFAWLTVLSGAPGCISWRARGYGQYKPLAALLERFGDYDLTRAKPQRIVNIREAYEWFDALTAGGEETCHMPEHFWCPDRLSTDGRHRYCIKAESGYVKRLAEIELWSLRYGRNYACSLDEGKPLMEWTEDDFRNGEPETPVSVSEGYQQKSLVTADGGLVISYLRNDTPYPVMTDAKDGTKTESFCLRTQTPRPVTVDLHDPSFRYELLDLETGCTCIVPAGKTFLGITDHDFAVVAERIPV